MVEVAEPSCSDERVVFDLEALDTTFEGGVTVGMLLRGTADPGRAAVFLVALVASLRVRHVTAVNPLEMPTLVTSELRVAAPPLSVLAENVLLLRHAEDQGAMRPMLSVRFSAFIRRIREVAIEPEVGIRIARPASPAAGSLTGLAQPVATISPGDVPSGAEAGS